MIYLNKIKIDCAGINQEFELGDLTIFIGRPNSGKTRILQGLFDKSLEARDTLEKANRIKSSFEHSIEKLRLKGIHANSIINTKKIIPKIIPSNREKLANINALSSELSKISGVAQKMDPKIYDLGSNEVQQEGVHRPLNNQGSGIQNMIHITSNTLKENFILIDEPEISQFPSGKIWILKHFLDLMEEKQIVLATHDPVLLNQYITKKLLNEKNLKIIMYSFCEDKFYKIDFDSNINPEIHCGYLNQTLSGKPIHLIFEGQTEFYAFQALLTRYCIEKRKHHIAKRLNKINISFLGGGQWRKNIHHVPVPELYEVLVILDGDQEKNSDAIPLPTNIKKIDNISEFSKGHINLMFLKSMNIEEAFEGIYDYGDIPKPFGLSERIWKDDREICKLLEDHSEKSKEIYSIIKWAMDNR